VNTFTDVQAILTAFFEGLPWPALMVDERGAVTFVNQPMRQLESAHKPVAGSLSLEQRFPAYFAALDGETPWLTEQSGTVTRRDQGVTITERISLHRLPFGACLFVVPQPESAATLGDAQLARLASLGFMVAGVCHELANPLTAINSTVQLLRAGPASPTLLEKGLANIASNAQRMLSISRKLNDFSRASDDARSWLNLRGTVMDAVALLEQDSCMQQVSVKCTLDEAIVVHGDVNQLQQVFCNVLTNAIQAMRGSGSLFIHDSRPDSGHVEIAIRDTGPGIAERDLPRLFEPFFTTKPAGHGTGLGLAISNEIVLAHGGTMRAANDGGGGACFYIRLPAASA
jgi:two-component system NtrC family sensor kinase